MSGRSLPRVLLLFAVVVWGWTFVATKVCLAWVSPVELLGLRLLLALPVMGAVLLLRRLPIDPRKRWRPILAGGVILAVHYLIQITGIRYTSATNSGWIIAVTPLVMALLAAVWLEERLSRPLMLGIAVATVGIVLLVSRGDMGGLFRLSSIGDWLVLASAHTWAFYTLAIRDAARATHPLCVAFWVLVPAAVLTVGIMLPTTDWRAVAAMPMEVWGALLFLGVPGMALTQWAWQEGVARIGAAEAGVFLYLEPLATTALAVPYLGEPFGPFTVAGGLLVLAGVATAQRLPRLLRRGGA
jgi:drug/metabolite transporter (DMT)-like permease